MHVCKGLKDHLENGSYRSKKSFPTDGLNTGRDSLFSFNLNQVFEEFSLLVFLNDPYRT